MKSILQSPGNKITITDVYAALKLILSYLARPLWVDPGTSRVKCDLSTSGTLPIVGTVQTVSTVSNQTQMAGFDIKQTLLYSTDRNLWANSIRTRIT